MSNYKDLDKRRATQKIWVEKNKEKYREKWREYQRRYKKKLRETSPEQRQKEREARKKYYAEHREEEQRKAREYMRRYYIEKKEQLSERRKAKYNKARLAFNEYLVKNPCSMCGVSDIDCLELHHVRPKGRINGRRVDPAITSIFFHSKRKLEIELAKCVVLCANCHRKEHARIRREIT